MSAAPEYERWVAETIDPDGKPLQVLITKWHNDIVTVATRRESRRTWGPPAPAEPR